MGLPGRIPQHWGSWLSTWGSLFTLEEAKPRGALRLWKCAGPRRGCAALLLTLLTRPSLSLWSEGGFGFPATAPIGSGILPTLSSLWKVVSWYCEVLLGTTYVPVLMMSPPIHNTVFIYLSFSVNIF